MPLNILFYQGSNEQEGPYVELRQWSDENRQDIVLEYGCNVKIKYDYEGYITSRTAIVEPATVILKNGALTYEYIRQAIAKYDELDKMYKAQNKEQ